MKSSIIAGLMSSTLGTFGSKAMQVTMKTYMIIFEYIYISDNPTRKKMLKTQFNPTGSETYIGVDIGGTNTRIGVFGSLDTPDFVRVVKFPTYQSYEEQLEQIIVAVRASNKHHLAGIGVSVAARIAKDGRSVIVAPNLPEYVNKPFVEDL